MPESEQPAKLKNTNISRITMLILIIFFTKFQAPFLAFLTFFLGTLVFTL